MNLQRFGIYGVDISKYKFGDYIAKQILHEIFFTYKHYIPKGNMWPKIIHLIPFTTQEIPTD